MDDFIKMKGSGNITFDADMAAVNKIYQDLEGKQAIFIKETGIHCPAGCGDCCTRFEPDILPVEAEFLAMQMLQKEGVDPAAEIVRMENLSEQFSQGVCPMQQYNVALSVTTERAAIAPAIAGACTVYSGRPLVCRIFGFASYADKTGNPVYVPCKLMTQTEESLQGTSKILAPIATAYGTRMESLRPQDAVQRLFLRKALVRAFQKIGMMFSFKES